MYGDLGISALLMLEVLKIIAQSASIGRFAPIRRARRPGAFWPGPSYQCLRKSGQVLISLVLDHLCATQDKDESCAYIVLEQMKTAMPPGIVLPCRAVSNPRNKFGALEEKRYSTGDGVSSFDS